MEILTVHFTLNKKEVTAECDPKMTLLQYLRGTACLKGTKEACGTGHCGACSVLLDGKLTRSCVTRMSRVDGHSVETIEGIAENGEMSVIQRAFLDAGAVQCGFCTPGMVIAATALLRSNPAPTDAEICEGLKHNTCRCTGYVKIIEAVKLAAGRLRGENITVNDVRTHESTTILVGHEIISDTDHNAVNQPNASADDTMAEQPDTTVSSAVTVSSSSDINKSVLIPSSGKLSSGLNAVPIPDGRWVGRVVWDVDGPAKVTGTLKYCDDYEADEFGAEEMLHGAMVWAPVPHARLNHVDLTDAEKAPGVVRILTWKDVPGLNKIGAWTPDQPVFCRDEVKFLGDYVALVIADTEKHAREAVSLVKIDYTELPGLYSIAEGDAAESYLVRTSRKSGDVEAARQREDLVKVTVSKDIEPQDHVCMEPVSCIGFSDGERVTVYSCTQAPFEMRTMLAKNLNLPEEKIRVKATPLGGGFGKKCDSYLEAPAALAGFLCRKPVKITLTRREDLILTTKRHGYHTDYEIGFTKDGKFNYLKSRMLSDGGPYEAESYGTLMTGCLMSGGPYIIPNVDVDARCIRDNNLQGGAFRGYGINQAAISIETAMDMMAEKLRIDPFELRRRNAVSPGTYSVGGELLESSMGMMDTIDRCEEALHRSLAEYEKLYPQGSKVLGWGMASGFKNVGVGKGIFIDDGACRLFRTENHLRMIVSGTDMGQGFRTAMVQIAAEVLGMNMDQIEILVGDTDISIPTGETVAERQTLCDGRAVYEACRKLKQDLESNPLKCGEERYAEYYFRAPECFPIGDFEGAARKGVRYRNFPAYAYATQAAIVEVDKDTGVVKLLKVIAAHDVGRAINPLAIEGQMHGSCSMGQGYALTEGFPTKNGYPVKKFYKDLGLPRAEDTPDYEILLIEDPEPLGPFGAKGVSEVATVPITPAILNAIYNAIGVRINHVPASPEVILAALREKAAHGSLL